VQPTIVQLDDQRYVGRRESVAMTEFAQVADHLPTMFGWLGERGVAVAGPPFFRYKVIDMAALLTVEAGIPVSGDVQVEAPTFVETLPGGRYVTAAHVGHPDELVAVTEELLAWAQHQGLVWDMTPTPEGEEWGCRLEILMTDPAQEPDMHKWETVLMFRLAD
jgi:effector-binding domain-containing protein